MTRNLEGLKAKLNWYECLPKENKNKYIDLTIDGLAKVISKEQDFKDTVAKDETPRVAQALFMSSIASVSAVLDNLLDLHKMELNK